MVWGILSRIAHIGAGQTIVGDIIFAQVQAGPVSIATLARCVAVPREAERMYPDGGVIGIVAVAPVVLFLISYLVYTQAPKHRHGKSHIRAASDVLTKFVQNASDTRDVRM
jgi:hypothetical protein